MFDLSEEYRQVASTHDVDWDELSGSSVLVTGATGLVGSLFVRALLERNRGFGSGITVYALVRSEEKARRAFEGYGPSDGLHFVVQDVCELSLDVSCDYILHAACPTASAFFTSHPAQTADAIVMGTRAVLEYARRCGCRSVVYVSSMEVYGEGNHEPGLAHALTESETGIVDPLAVRSCYPEGKRMAENYCVAYASEYDVPVKIARLAQTFGPGVPKDDKRLFAQIARSAMLGDDLVLKTTGASTRMPSPTEAARTTGKGGNPFWKFCSWAQTDARLTPCSSIWAKSSRVNISLILYLLIFSSIKIMKYFLTLQL